MKATDKKTTVLSITAIIMVILIVAIAGYDRSPCASSEFMAEQPVRGLRFGMTKLQALMSLEDANIIYNHQEEDPDAFILSIQDDSLSDSFGTVGTVSMSFKNNALHFVIYQHNFSSFYERNAMFEMMRSALNTRYGISVAVEHRNDSITAWSWAQRDGALMNIMSAGDGINGSYAAAVAIACNE